MELSTNCEQKIQHRCKFHRLTGVSSWTGRDGSKNRYWYGDHDSFVTGCQCKENQSCTRSYGVMANQCNCDNDVDSNATDIGIISSLTKELISNSFIVLYLF